MKEKIKSYDFWIAIASALFMALQAVGLKNEIPYLQEITTAFLGLLAVGGFIVKPPTKQEESKQDVQNEQGSDSENDAQEVENIIDEIIDNNDK